MAGERLPASSSAHGMPGDGSWVADGCRERASNDKAGRAGKGGKLRLSRPAFFKRKPYDRPGNPGTLDRPLPSGPTASLPARFVDSASNLITSSASYLFESFFKRRKTLWIGNGERSAGRTSSADSELEEGERPYVDNFGEVAIAPSEGPVLEAHHGMAKSEDVDFARVEGILKQQFLSREEVKRLTDALQNQPYGGDVVGHSSESDGRHVKTKKVDEEANPVQLAKAFMSEHSSHLVSGTPVRTPYHYGDGAGPSTVKRIKKTIYERSFGQGSTALPASAERMRKRRLIADDDDNDTPRVPTRRVRQRMTIMANSSPYIRQVTMASGPLRTSSFSLVQLSEKPEKAQEALEECPIPAVKGKSVEEPAAVVACTDAVPAESLRARENSETLSKEDPLSLPISRDLDNMAAVEPVPLTDSKAVEKSAVGSQAGSPAALPTNIPERTKGFHMSAFFEDSSSDEESGPVVKKSTSGESERPESLISQGALQPDTKKQPFVFLPNEGSVLSAADFSIKALPPSLLTTTAAGSSNLSSGISTGAPPVAALSPSFVASTPAMGKSIAPVSNAKPLPLVSHSPSMTEKEAPSHVPASPPEPTLLPVMPISLPVKGEALVTVAPSSSPVEVETPSPMSVSGGVAAEERGLSPAPTSPPTVIRATETSIAMVSDTAPAAASKPAVPLVTTVSPTVPIASSGVVPAIAPAIFQVGSTRGAHAAGASPADSSLNAGRGVTFASGYPASEKLSDGDTMATDPMTEEPASSFVPSSASPFSFGSASSAPTSLVQLPSFMSNTASTSSFSFPTLSSTPAPGANSSTQSPFNIQSSGSSGQLFTFGASGTSSPNPFSVNTQSSFSFGSSSATLAPPSFTATPSAPPTFPATAPTPSFQFAASSSSTSLTSMFGAQMTPTASAFAAPGSQSTAPAFAFSAPPTSSATTAPSPSPFQFGGAGASAPSFGGQAFSFGAQPAAANPFAQTGASNAAPFQFGSSAAPSQSVFSSGGASPLASSFGAQPSGSPFPFTFGGQAAAPSTGQPFGGQAAAPSIGQSFGGQAAAPSTGQPFGGQVAAPSTGQPFGGQVGAPSTGQPFSFGGQPAAPAQGSFPSAGSTGQNPFAPAGASGMDFGGGFSLGVAGGEKSGRKYIKAKRIGGAKRGK